MILSGQSAGIHWPNWSTIGLWSGTLEPGSSFGSPPARILHVGFPNGVRIATPIASTEFNGPITPPVLIQKVFSGTLPTEARSNPVRFGRRKYSSRTEARIHTL